MANELKLYYSSGSKVENTFDGQPNKSIGGIVTSTKVPQSLGSLFGKISLKALSQGSDEYRCIFLQNDGTASIPAVASTGSITISNNAVIAGDTIDINGTTLVEGVDFAAGGTAADTATAVKDAIDGNGALNILITVEAVGNILNITAITAGVGGDAITLAYIDAGGGVSVTLSGANLTGGVDVIPATDITDLKLYTDVATVAAVNDPADLVPAPVIGDKWIVPTGGTGEWLNATEEGINTLIGKKAVYNGTGWDFSFADFAAFEYGFVAPVDINLASGGKTNVLTDSFVEPIENVFETPSGIEFNSADTVANEILIGDLAVDARLGMWIRRKVAPFKIESFDLETDEGGIVIDEVMPLKFGYDTP